MAGRLDGRMQTNDIVLAPYRFLRQCLMPKGATGTMIQREAGG